VPGVDGCGEPLAAVSWNRLPPRACRPAGLMKSTSWIWPTVVGAESPATSTETVPSVPTVIDWVSSGTVSPGCSR